MGKNVVVAYTYDSSESYNIPVRKMVCSTEVSEKLLLRYSYYSGSKDRWYSDDDGFYHQYATRISDDFRFMSTPYSEKSVSSLSVGDFNKLGTNCTDGDIWLSVSDAKWIYDNCDEGTQIKAYSNVSTPLLIPGRIKLEGEAAEKGWDPTDPASENPFKKAVPTFTGVEDVTIPRRGNFSPLVNVEAYDSFGNKVTKGIKTDGNVVISRPGKYVISYYYTDALNRTGRVDRTVTVE